MNAISAKKFLQQSGLVVALIASVSVNVVLAGKMTANARRLASVQAAGRLAVGTKVSPIIAKDLAGNAVEVGYAGSSLPTVVYVMRPTCGWCLRNGANFTALENAAAGHFRLVVLSTERKDLDEYAKVHFHGAQVLTDIDPATTREYMLGGTPQTILIGTDGKVQRNWNGAYTGVVADEVSKALGLRLPGLLASAQATAPSMHAQ